VNKKVHERVYTINVKFFRHSAPKCV